MDKNIMDNITKIHFNPDQDYIWGIKGLKQWDKCQKLEISGLNISDEIVEVHFSLDQFQGTAERMLGVVKDGVIHAGIPAFILEGPEYLYNNTEVYNAYAWVYVSDEESAETIRKMEFEIKARPKPNEYASPDKQDPFLEEIRKVLTDTKQIAQSVRDDANNGVFDGEQGPKGDAGSIKFIIAPTLPTEDIDTSAIYLVRLEQASEGNAFLEYIYVDGAWEYIGSASVEVNLEDYVKNTDYATQKNAGVIKVHSGYGMNINGAGILYPYMADSASIDEKTNLYRVITPSNLDYAVMKALSDSKLEWTDEQKQLARALLDTIGANNLANASKNGVVKVDSRQGISISQSSGVISVVSANESEIDEKSNIRKPITPSVLDYAVKKALSDCKLTGDDVWTDEEKAKALEFLGGIKKPEVNTNSVLLIENGKVSTGYFSNFYPYSYNFLRLSDESRGDTIAGTGYILSNTPTRPYHTANKKYVDEGFLQLNKNQSVYHQVYAKKSDGTQQMINYSVGEAEGTIPQRGVGGVLAVGTPTADVHATTKKYVDDLVGDIETLLGGI